VEDGDNLDKIRPDAIHDAIVAADDLAKCLVANLKNDATGQRIGLEMVDDGYQTSRRAADRGESRAT
jgi:hypothetical protein